MKRAQLILLLVLTCVALVFAGFYNHREKSFTSDGLSSASHDSKSAVTIKPAPDAGNNSAKMDSATVSEFAREMLEGSEWPRLSDEQIEAFVESRGRSAEVLIAAFELTEDSEDREAFLAEAANRFPDSPQVALAMIGQSADAEDRELWISKLKKNDPDNSVGFMLGASEAMNAGNLDEVLENLNQAGAAKRTDFFSSVSGDQMVEAYQSGGFDGVKGEILGTYRVSYPLLTEMRDLTKDVSAAMAMASDTSDAALATDLGKAGIEMAARIRESDQNILINLVGNNMERTILKEMNELDLIPGTTEFVFERKEAISAYAESVKAVTSATSKFTNLNDAQFGEYFRLMRNEGEYRALEWLAQLDVPEP